jgi:uncharacterized protein
MNLGKINRRTLIDTGPLVAILRHGDRHHDDCRAIFASYTEPLITCWPVVTETMWLVRHHPAAVNMFLSFFEEQILAVLSLKDGSPSWFSQFFDKYATVKPDFADAALVHLAEREAIDTIFTLDRRSFSSYRDREGRPFRLLP